MGLARFALPAPTLSMRLTIRTNLAMRTLMACAVNPNALVRKSEIAAMCNASEHHLGQVIRLLAHHQFIHAQRGRNGGVKLARPAKQIKVGSVFRALEYEHPFAECFDPASNTCPLVDCCWLRPALQKAIGAFYAELDRVDLSQLVRGNVPLERMLMLVPACEQRPV